MNGAEILELHQGPIMAGLSVAECFCGARFHGITGKAEQWAAHVLDELQAAGHAVVELPEMVGVNGTDNAVWCRSPYIEQEFNGDVLIADRIGFDVDELRTIAAALLAAEAAASRVAVGVPQETQNPDGTA